MLMRTFKHSFIAQSSGTVWPTLGVQATIENMGTEKAKALEVGERLDALIKASGMSYVEFGRMVANMEGPDSKVGPATVLHWRKTGKIARGRLTVICKVLNITPDVLLGVDSSVRPEYTGKEVGALPPMGGMVVERHSDGQSTILGTLDRLRDQLDRAPNSVKQQVISLAMTYIQNPEDGARIGRAIEALLEEDMGVDSAI